MCICKYRKLTFLLLLGLVWTAALLKIFFPMIFTNCKVGIFNAFLVGSDGCKIPRA